jgi:hypothetical protein
LFTTQPIAIENPSISTAFNRAEQVHVSHFRCGILASRFLADFSEYLKSSAYFR